MKSNNIKFKFENKFINRKDLDKIFDNIGLLLNIRFDKHLKPYRYDTDKTYTFKDISTLNQETIEKEINNFFNYSFNEITDSTLYKFLVLKNNDKIIILGNIHQLIFDYTSIKKIYNLFNKFNPIDVTNKELYYNKERNHSLEFKKDSEYWKNHILDIGKYIKFYNIKSNNYNKINIPLNNETIQNFLDENNISKFEYVTAIFSLYLSRIDRTKGCILKTILFQNNDDLGPFDIESILKIKYQKKANFIDYLNEIKHIPELARQHTKIDLNNYFDINSFYSIYDFTGFNDISIINGEGSALTINIYDNSIELIYNTDLFNKTYIEHMIKNIESLINNIGESPNQICCDIDILSNEEKNLISRFSKAKTIEFNENKTLGRAFRENAKKYPNLIAIDDGINQITYAELESSSNSIAYDLNNNYDINIGDNISLMLPRDYHYPELVLALNKIGAAFIPIDPDYPLKRVEHMLNISESKYIVTTKEYAHNLNLDTDIICIEDLNRTYENPVECCGDGDNIFAIIFTSRTTGLPKGAMVSNKEFIGVETSMRDIYKSSPGDISGCYASFSFIVSFRMFASLYFGETCRLFNEKERGDSLLVIKALKNQPLNDLILPPSLGLSIANEDINLKYMLLAGAKFDNLPKEKNNTQLANLYGTTETHCSIVGFLNADHVTLGKPIANTWTYILDENKKQVPVGIAGNLYISRNHLSPGYYNRPDLTNEVFVENPHYDCKDNKKMYNTGDIAFYNFDGEIEIIGREDNQLSVRGFRVESDEILKIMHNFDSISNIYLDVDNDNLIAYYTTNQDLNIDKVKNALKNELPPYMIPSIFIKLDEIPLNINGKIDKFALKKTTHNRVNVEINDKTLKQVIETFMEVLNLDYILMDDDFVSLGRNSLSAMKLQLLLKEKLDYNISSNEIMELSTPLNITNHIKFNLNNQSIDKLKYAFDKSCPLSESQLNVYLDEKVNKLGTRYNNPFKIELNNEYSIEDIKIALKKLFELYPVLSSRINNNDTPSFTFDAKLEIIEGTCEDIKSFVQPFDLDKCLSHFLIVKNNESTSLYVDFHHLIMDGTSADILLNKLLKILKGFKFDSIDNGILRQVFFEKNIDSHYMDDAERFFDNMLTDTEEVSPLLTPIQTDKSLDDEFTNELNLDVDIESFLKKHGLTHNQFFCSVFAYTLSRFTGSSKVLFNLIEDGRGHIDLADSVGMYVRTLPLLMDCKNQNISSFLDYSSNLINLTMKYDLYPFRLLANKYDLNSNILFQYSHEIFKNFNNQNIIPLKHDYTNDISFYIFNSQENKFGIRVEFSDKYSKEFIEHFVESYKLILKDMLCVNKLGDIHYTSSADIKLLDGYNKTEHEFKYKDILDAFNDNLKKYGDNILVGYGNKSYTYGQGAFIANEIASKLNEMGVVKQDFVGLFVNRSEWYLLASIGVLAKNAIYVPIETTYPDERIILMLEDSSSRIVIVDDNSEKRMLQIISKYNLNIDVLNVNSILDKDIGSLNHLDTVPTSENDVACVLYTSGTTGTPKGVLITRKAINNFVSWYVDETNFTQNDVYGMHCSYVFDIHTNALYSPVITGGSLYIVPEDIRLNLKALNDYFVEHNCTHTYITSQVGKLFAESGMKTTIKLLCFGGMKLGELNAPDSIGPFESYGPSENLAISTSIFANKRIHPSSIGNFISNVKGYVLDNEHRRVPLGAVGELYLSGHQLTPGYLNRDQENENTFFNNIFDDEKGYEHIYKTGDIVRFLPDGTLGIVGRSDSQVKIRGNRVELTEVESAIRNIDEISDVTVQTVDNNGNNELVAYVVLSNNLDVNLNDYISSYVDERKPDYMVPSYVIKLDHIPLNVNGKVDKKALPEIDINSLRAEYAAPTNTIEQDIVEAFEKVFNQEKISIHDDFIRLGGDSLTAIKLISHLENYNITAADILTLRTPHVIAENLNELTFDSDIYSLDSGCPLSEPQLNVYLDIIANAKKDAYLIPLSMEISNAYDSKEIYEALETMIEVHPILGMCVSDEFEVPYLIKVFQPPIILKTNVDEDYIKEFLKKPFNMYNNLCRFLIIENEENYQIFAVFHHIIFDGFSDNIFKRDFEEILNGKHVEIDDSFLKVSAFTQSIQNTEEYDKANNFYQSMLADYDEVNPLLDSVLADGPGIEKIRLNLDSNLLKSFLNKHNISENILFTSVFAYTLSRFVGSDKVLFNIIENGRDRFNNFNSIGMYVNTLPLLIDCKNKSISSFMDHTSNLVYNVMKYNYYAFRLLAHEYDLTSNILFQFIPEWIMDGDGNSYLNDYATTEREDLISDLSIDIIQKGKEYDLIVEYSDKYSNNFIKHLIKTYDKILQEMLNVNELKEINYISKEDINLLDSYNQTEHELIYDDILDAFNDNLSKNPNNKLVSFKDISYTYAEGAYIAKQIADKLKDLGIKQQDYVAFLVEPVEYIFCILGVLSYGAVYIPLNSSYPDDHIDFILKDTSSKAIIADDNTYERAKTLGKDVIILNISDIIKENINNLSYLPVKYGKLSCILYTSGTTGRPKGVKITRKSILNYVSYYTNRTNMTSNDVLALFSSISFDVGAIKSIFAPIYSGSCLDIIPKSFRLNMKELNKYFNDNNITHADFPTQIAKLFFKENDSVELKILVTGGEKLGEINTKNFEQLIDAYGPTETCVSICSIKKLDKIDSSSIGHLLYNNKIYILDNEFRRVPIGAVGELYISGYQVADGYLNHVKETRESFLNNPFTNDPDYNTMYRTGDIVRILPDGTLGIVGRRDSQVKIRGNRVELSEVEAVIREIDYVEDTTVQINKNSSNYELIAYVVVSEEIYNLKESICSYVSERKPDYMVPSYVIKLDNIPLNVNGKVDKKALPEIDINSLRAEYVAPETETQKLIVEAFEEVFSQEKISLYDDFVRLGGDSLTAIKLLSYLDSPGITAADILTLHTPYAIAENIKEDTLDLDMYTLESGCPLNEPQLNVYLDIIANNMVNSYLIPLNIVISKEYDVDEIHNALNVMLDVHPILEMCVSDEFEVPYLVKGLKPPITFKSNADDEFVNTFLTKGFDLNECLSKFLVVEKEDKYELFAVFHHIIFDAISENVFKRDLQIILDGGAVDVDDSFLKVSAFTQQIKDSEEYSIAHDFYNSMLTDVDEAGMFLDSVLPDGPGVSFTDLDLDHDLFKSFLDKYGVSENVLFISIFAYTLSRFTGNNKVLFNIIENGRDRFNNLDAIGMYVNTLPILVDCKNQSVSDFMNQMSDLVYDVMRHNYYSFRLLASEYELNSNILFQYLPDWIGSDEGYDIDEDNNLEDMSDLITEFNVNVIQKGDEYSLHIMYSDKYSCDMIKSFAGTYNQILSQMICLDELSDINYVSQSDLDLLDSINDKSCPLVYSDVLDAFNENLAKTPDNPLVSYKDVSYSYGEGAFVADKIAKTLIDMGIEPQENVAFLVECCELYMFCVLGILSTGAVYVPLDTAHPDERIGFMIKDTSSKVVLVSDETYTRAKDMVDDSIVLLNISKIVKGNIETLDKLPVVYGDLACMLYTSGSTGLPKAVKITRKSILNISQYYEDTYGLSCDDVYGLYASIGFDLATFSIFAAVYVGACLSVVPDDIRLNMSELNQYYIRQGIKHTVMTTQVAKLFIDHIDKTSLEVLLTGGEKLGEFRGPDEFTLIDVYGPTESFMFTNTVVVNDKIDYSSVGFLNYNVKAYILDAECRRVPFGAVGELYLAGYQIADGYLNRDEETTKAFLENPFDEREDYSVMYRTGDIVRVLADGSLGIVGRRDSQVKIRGNRVELSEIEAVIREIDFIEDLTVQTIKHGTNNELVAYVVVDNDLDGEALSDSICDYVGERKPEYMVPSYVIRLDEIPLNVNGKVDKRALPEVDVEGLRVEYVAPTTETEKIIVEAFESVFDQEIGIYDDFARLGGDSISAIRVISFIQKNGISCSAKDVLTYKTPYMIAQNIGEIDRVSYDAVEGEVALLPIQSYFFDQINTNEFSQEFILKAKNDLDLEILQKSFDELTKIHDMLRVNYRYEGDNVVQEILPVDTRICEINEIRLTGDFNTAISDFVNESISSIDMNNNLINVSLVRHDDECYVVLVIHHLIIDGVSWGILIDDLTHIYTQIIESEEISLLRPYPYKNWVEDVNSLVENISDNEKQHWEEVNALLDESSIKGNSKAFNFSVDVSFDIDNLLMLSEEEYLALCIARAYKKTYGEDIIFNRESYGRDETVADVSRTIGWFTTQYPVPVNVNNENDNISLMKDVYSIKTAFKDINHLGLNYGSLIYSSKELEFKHCPVTFNFLSTEFAFKNELFESFNEYLSAVVENDDVSHDSTIYGVSFNVARLDDSYVVNGDYAESTYLGDKFDEFVENVKHELKFIGEYETEEIVCRLSEPQLGIYLDEKVNDMGTAYAAPDIYECGLDKSIDEIKNAIACLIEKHPVLKGRVVDGDIPLLVCDSYPSIDTADEVDYTKLIKPFDLDKSLARFSIIETDENKYIFYDFHHMINDATSRTVVYEDLNSIFDGTFDDTVDFGFVYASRDSFESKFSNDYKKAYDFFNRNLSDMDEVSTMGYDLEGIVNIIGLPIHGVRSQVEDFCREYGITVGNFLNAVFAYTYSRFTGNDKMYYTYTEHGRHEEYNQKSLGMFVRTIPLIIDCKNRSVKDYLLEVSDLVLDSMNYSIYPFRLLASEFDLHNDVSFEFNHDLNDISHVGNDLIIENMDFDLVADFSCCVNNLADGYFVSMESSHKYSNETIIHFLNVFKEILIQMLDNGFLSDIDYVSDEDLEILDTINQTEYSLDYEDILDAFNENLKENPDNALVSYCDVSYTYAEGAFIANKLANALKNIGVESQDNVAFLVERSELYMFSVLGILSVGAIYVPLDDKHPDDRIQFILENTESKVVIVDDDTYERAELLNDDVILLNISDILKEGIGTLDKLPVVYGDVACMLYTSGTTGLPKGVKVTRKSVLNIAAVYVDKFDFGNDDVYGMFANISFDAGSWAICQTIYAGACLSIVPDDIKLNVHELNKYFVDHGVTHTMITTQVGKLFMESVEDTSLDVLMVGGEKLGDFESPEDYLLIDGFGPTETFAFISSINNNDKIDSSSIGDINYNTKFYVLDDEFRRVPVGAVGELYVSGYQVASGYLNREEENITAFLDNPFDSDENHTTLYRTGDMVRMLPDKTLAIVGRRDNQVKIRGNRVELSEIEAVMREIDYVDDVTVQTIKSGTNNELVAYVVISDDLEDSALREIIQDYVGERKPEYMIPSFVIELDEIPLTVNGKVDKHALPEVDRSGLHVEYVAPTSKAEKLIVHAFEEVFNHDKIGIYDDFARLGGDSLTAIKVLSYLEDYNVTAADILSLRTPFAIAESIKEDTLDLDVYTLEDSCPLNEPQLNVYLDIVANDKFDIYLIPTIMDIAKDYDVEEILEALDVMLDVHPILSTCISNDNEMPCLIKGFKPSIEFKPDVDDDYLMEFLTKPFDLYDSLSRFLVVGNDGVYSLYAVFHHIIFDALSVGVFKKDLQAILDGSILEVDDSFLKVSAFSQQIQETEEYVDAKSFYDKMLADSDEVNGLLDSADGDDQGIIQLDLGLDLTQFKSFLNKYKVSENVLFTGAFAYTLSRFTGSEKVFFNVNENGRGRFNNYNAIGMYVNTLPMLVDCKNQNVSDFMEYMSGLVYDVMKYNYYPFRLLAKEYGIDSSILFQFMPEWIDSDDTDYSEFESMQEDNDSESVENLINDLSIDIVQKGKSYLIYIQYSARYSEDVMNRFVESYKSILSQIICVDKLSEINYVSDSDLDLLDTYNQTEHALKYNDILDAFNDNLSNNPNNTLVSYNDDVYSYAEGAFIANKLANRLWDMGVESQDKVAFLVERSELYMFCVLGVMSMGAIYVPLDDKHPDDRIQFILGDTQASVLIVDNSTYEHAELLADDAILLNISDLMKEDVGTLDKLPVEYGDLACILYTSGTTGIPKGVKITRKSVLNLSEFYIRKYGLSEDDVYALFASIGFDVAMKAIFPTICSGACLTIIPDAIKLDMASMNDYFIEHGVTHTEISTQVAKLFISQVDETSLKVLTTGGEKLGGSEIDVDYRFVDSYGPTEACVDVTSIDSDERIDPSSIGFLLDNIKAYVLDDEFRRVPIGAVGELYLAGYQVADGYLNRDEENAHAFIENPFDDSEDFHVMYRTGDIVRFLPDRSLGIVGRQDSQVKIRGNRVELPEIEEVICEIDYINDVTVQTVKHSDNKEVVAYVVVSEEFDESTLKDMICDYIGERKPNYMIPSYIVKLDSIPLTVNGKVDKKALPEVDTDNLRAGYVAPTNPIEQKIVEAFEKVFNQKKISIHDDFIRLGGNSLTAIRMISLLDFNIDVRTLLNSRTPHLIAQNIQKNNKKYGFELFKTGFENRNMFIFPPQGGLSSVFYNLVNNIDFKGNIYLIDDYKYDLSLDEIRSLSNQDSTLNHYFDAITNIFQNGDILVGYSLGCIYATLIAEKLEKDRVVGKCILIDGVLNFSEEKDESRENIIDYFFNNDEFKYMLENSEDDFKNKFIEVCMANSKWDFHTPRVNCPILYLATSNNFKEELNEISDDYKFIIIDSTHKDIIDRDVSKIVKYFNNLS